MGGVPIEEDDPWEAVMAMDRHDALDAWQRAVREGGSLFGGAESAFAQAKREGTRGRVTATHRGERGPGLVALTSER